MPVSIANVLDEVVKIINFIKPWCLSTPRLLHTEIQQLYFTYTWNTWKFFHEKMKNTFSWKNTCAIEGYAELLFFLSWINVFTWKNDWQSIVLKKEWSEPVSTRQQLTVFIANDKIGNGSSENWIFGKLNPVLWAWQLPNI